LEAHVFTFASSPFVPIAIGFFGLGTGYLIWGGQALTGFPKTSPEVNESLGLWGFWMQGFMQFLTGIYLLIGLTWFNVLGMRLLCIWQASPSPLTAFTGSFSNDAGLVVVVDPMVGSTRTAIITSDSVNLACLRELWQSGKRPRRFPRLNKWTDQRVVGPCQLHRSARR
jgi:hypothetical protein